MIQPPDWKLIDLSQNEVFQQIEPQVIQQIKTITSSIDPIIQQMFNDLVEQCLMNYQFDENAITFSDYLRFYGEVNRIYNRKTKKIISTQTPSTAYFVGDIHGAIHESFLLVDFFYQILQEDPSIKIVFVGDYVDRNPYDLESLTLITAFHLLFPDNIILLRGNHETQEINEHYGFYDNLLRTYRENTDILYQKILMYFQKLPIVSIVEIVKEPHPPAKVMVVHGGIPIDPLDPGTPIDLETLESRIHSEVPITNQMDPLTISMLWSDPDEMIQEISSGNQASGRMRFGSSVFREFMEKNHIDLLIRGHQKWTQGYHVFFEKLYSLFSTSTYDGRVQFDPKILRLEYGRSPKLIPIIKEELQQEIDMIGGKL